MGALVGDGSAVGALVGATVGALVGAAVASLIGATVASLVGATVGAGVALGTALGTGVALGAEATAGGGVDVAVDCGVELHPANKPAAANFMKFRLDIPDRGELSFSFVIVLSFNAGGIIPEMPDAHKKLSSQIRRQIQAIHALETRFFLKSWFLGRQQPAIFKSRLQFGVLSLYASFLQTMMPWLCIHLLHEMQPVR